jgi:hypothetical protein
MILFKFEQMVNLFCLVFLLFCAYKSCKWWRTTLAEAYKSIGHYRTKTPNSAQSSPKREDNSAQNEEEQVAVIDTADRVGQSRVRFSFPTEYIEYGCTGPLYTSVNTPKIPDILRPKSTDRPKLLKFEFDDYRINYFTKKTDDGFQCHINLSNAPCVVKSCAIKNITPECSPETKLRVRLSYGNMYTEGTLVLEQKITSNTVLANKQKIMTAYRVNRVKYLQSKNYIFVISFQKVTEVGDWYSDGLISRGQQVRFQRGKRRG